MNVWDFVTWLSAAGLGIGAVVIFALFLRDARGILEREGRDRGRECGEQGQSASIRAERRVVGRLDRP